MTCRSKISIALVLAAILAPAAFAQETPRAGRPYAPWPDPDSGYVTDRADLLPADQEEALERLLWQCESKTGVEIIVVTLPRMADYPDTNVKDVELFARGLFNAWGIGNMPKNDGVLLLVCRDDRSARIELGARHGRARDGDADRIMQGIIVPAFKKGRYAEGIREGTHAIMREFAGVRVGVNWPFIAAIALIPIAALTMISLFRNGKRGWGWVVAGILILLLLVLVKAVWTILRVMPRGGDDGGGSSGWSSGGLGGFGGGFSGGGGATGHW